LRERLQRESGRAGEEDLADELMKIGKRCAALPVLDPRSPDEILGYDEHGIPR
jgi:antitoxin VapB